MFWRLLTNGDLLSSGQMIPQNSLLRQENRTSVLDKHNDPCYHSKKIILVAQNDVD